MTIKHYEFHEVANIFPMMTDEEFNELVLSINNNAQREPIILHEGKIIDGRNRYNACLKLDIEPWVKDWDGVGSLLEYVKDKNLNRRQLTQSQKAMVGARMIPLWEKYGSEAKARMFAGKKVTDPEQKTGQGRALRTNEYVGEVIGANKTYVADARRVINIGSDELVNSVDSGEISLNVANNIVKLPKEQQVTALDEYRQRKQQPKPKPLKKEDAKKQTSEWLAKNTTEFSEEDKQLDGMVDKIVLATTQSLQEISNFVPTMSNKANVYTILRRAIRATDKYINDLESIEFNNRKNEGVE